MVAELEQADDRQLLGQLMITYANGAIGATAHSGGFRVCMLDPAWRRQRRLSPDA